MKNKHKGDLASEMTTTSERKRDAAFKLLASFGFEWNGKAYASGGHRLPLKPLSAESER